MTYAPVVVDVAAVATNPFSALRYSLRASVVGPGDQRSQVSGNRRAAGNVGRASSQNIGHTQTMHVIELGGTAAARSRAAALANAPAT